MTFMDYHLAKHLEGCSRWSTRKTCFDFLVPEGRRRFEKLSKMILAVSLYIALTFQMRWEGDGNWYEKGKLTFLTAIFFLCKDLSLPCHRVWEFLKKKDYTIFEFPTIENLR